LSHLEIKQVVDDQANEQTAAAAQFAEDRDQIAD
jgi:hypothetical protein